MKKLRIPKSYQPGFSELFKIQADQLKIFANDLIETPFVTKRSDLIKQLSGKDYLSKINIRPVVNTLSSISVVRDNFKLDVDGFVSELNSALIESFSSDHYTGVSNELKSFFETIFSRPTILMVYGKIEELNFNRERIFRNSDIFTDVRPITIKSDNSKVLNSTLLYSLILSYTENSEFKDITVALGLEDLEELRDQINATIEQNKLLKEYYGVDKILELDENE